MMAKTTKLLTLDEAASFLGASKVSLRRWTNDGLLDCHRIGPQGRRRFELEQLKKFAERNNSADAPPGGGRATPCIASIQSWRLNRGGMCASISGIRSNNGRYFGDIFSTIIAAASRHYTFTAPPRDHVSENG